MAWSSLRSTLRALRRTPAFTGGVVVVFALGLGLNAAIFSVLDAVLLAPVPLPQPDRLVELWQTQAGGAARPVAPANFLDWRRSATSFQGLESYHVASVVMGGSSPQSATRREVAIVSGSFFGTLGAPALRGTLSPPPDAPDAVVLGEAVWREQFGADETLIGRTVLLDGGAVQVVGVAPRSFALPPDAALWRFAPRDVAALRLPMSIDVAALRDARYLGVYGRLRTGVSIEAARAEMLRIGEQLSAEYPDANREAAILVDDLQESASRPLRPALRLLGAAALSVLLLANLNLGHLFLARAARRRHELDVRTALGVSRARLIASEAGEALLLALMGGVVALGVAAAGGRILASWLPGVILLGREVSLSWRVAGLVFAITSLSALATALAPTLLAARRSVARRASLSGARIAGDGSRSRHALVAAQASLASALLLSAGLLMQSVWNLSCAPVGFESQGVWSARLTLPAVGPVADAAGRRMAVGRAVDALASQPGVSRAGAIQKLPLTGVGMSANLRVEGVATEADAGPDVAWRAIHGDYLATLNIALVEGRSFDAGDQAAAEPVAVVNATLGAWLERTTGQSALGRRVATGLDGERGSWVRVVGIVADTPQEAIGAPVYAELLRPLAQAHRFGAETVRLVAQSGAVPSLASWRSSVLQAMPDAALDDLRPLDALAGDSFRRQTVLARLLGLFALIALILAASGVHAVVALGVERRRREIGVRLALGARAVDIARQVLTGALGPVLAGLVAGAVLAVAGAPLLRGWLYGVTAADPAALMAVPMLLVAVSALAAWAPARSAARTDPATVLRAD